MRRLATCALPFLLACGGTAPEPEHPHSRRRSSGSPTAAAEAPRPAPRRSARELSRTAVFGDLIAGARRQDELRDQESEAACLISITDAGFVLSADLAVAVRPLPDAAEDLDERLERETGPVLVLTRFGAMGPSEARLALVSATTSLPPTRAALVLFVTERGIHARRTDRPADRREPARGASPLQGVDLGGIDMVLVTAEAHVTLSAVIPVLEALPTELLGRVALGVPLEDGTRLPASAVAASEGEPICADGLSELSEDAAEGTLGAQQIVARLDPLRRGAEICVGATTGPGAAGGNVAIDVRVGPDGRVTEACVSADATNDGQLRACLGRAARQLAFDPPGGYVDFSVPLALRPGQAHRQRPVCR